MGYKEFVLSAAVVVGIALALNEIRKAIEKNTISVQRLQRSVEESTERVICVLDILIKNSEPRNRDE
jgi:hypothetical protein